MLRGGWDQFNSRIDDDALYVYSEVHVLSLIVCFRFKYYYYLFSARTARTASIINNTCMDGAKKIKHMCLLYCCVVWRGHVCFDLHPKPIRYVCALCTLHQFTFSLLVTYFDSFPRRRRRGNNAKTYNLSLFFIIACALLHSAEPPHPMPLKRWITTAVAP